jgi:hypothetical protein
MVGEPVHVAANATPAELEAKRLEVNASLDAATDAAYRIADGAR